MSLPDEGVKQKVVRAVHQPACGIQGRPLTIDALINWLQREKASLPVELQSIATVSFEIEPDLLQIGKDTEGVTLLDAIDDYLISVYDQRVYLNLEYFAPDESEETNETRND